MKQILIYSILLILSAWNLNTFIRLKNASKSYDSNQSFEDACHVSKTYVNGGLVIASVMVLFSAILLGWELYKK